MIQGAFSVKWFLLFAVQMCKVISLHCEELVWLPFTVVFAQIKFNLFPKSVPRAGF